MLQPIEMFSNIIKFELSKKKKENKKNSSKFIMNKKK